MAALRKPHWLFALWAPKPRAKETKGILAFNKAAYNESKGATPKLKEVYRRYRDSQGQRAA